MKKKSKKKTQPSEKWTLFWDMHSGGTCKQPPYEKIYIQAPQKEAEVIFYNRFGHSPNRVSCTCCGEDYSINESESFEDASGYHRGCWTLQRKEYHKVKGWEHSYVESKDIVVPQGFKLEKCYGSEKYQTVEEYIKNKEVLVIRKEDILPEDRVGEVPRSGYVWID